MAEQTNVAATAAGIMGQPLTTVAKQDHVAAAAYLMKHAGTTALVVMDAQTGQPIGIIYINITPPSHPPSAKEGTQHVGGARATPVRYKIS